MYMKKIPLWACAIFLLSVTTQTQASLIGDTVACGIEPSSIWECTPLTGNVVGAGAEYTLDLGNPGTTKITRFSIDLGASSIALNYVAQNGLSMGAGELLTLSSLDWVGFPTGAIIGIDNFNNTASLGIDSGDVSFSANMVQIDLNDSNWQQGQFLSFDLIVDHGNVPAPATLALLGLGFAGLGWTRRKQS